MRVVVRSDMVQYTMSAVDLTTSDGGISGSNTICECRTGSAAAVGRQNLAFGGGCGVHPKHDTHTDLSTDRGERTCSNSEGRPPQSDPSLECQSVCKEARGACARGQSTNGCITRENVVADTVWGGSATRTRSRCGQPKDRRRIARGIIQCQTQ